NLKQYGGFFDYPRLEAELQEVEETIAGDPEFWTSPDKSAPILKKKKSAQNALERAKKLAQSKDDMIAALELSEADAEYLGEAQELLEALEKELVALEVQSLLGGELDPNDA